MKVGLSIKLDVTKIDKERLFQGAKGTYLDLTTFIDTAEQDQYENNGFVSQSTSAEEREQGVKTPILGNVKVFFTEPATLYPANTGPEVPEAALANNSKAAPFDEDIPF